MGGKRGKKPQKENSGEQPQPGHSQQSGQSCRSEPRQDNVQMQEPQGQQQTPAQGQSHPPDQLHSQRNQPKRTTQNVQAQERQREFQQQSQSHRYQESPRSQDLQREGPQQASAWQGQSQKQSKGYQESPRSQGIQRIGPPQASAWQGQSQKPSQGYQQSPRSQDLQREGPPQASAWQGQSQKPNQGYQQSPRSQDLQREGPQQASAWQGQSQKQSKGYQQSPRSQDLQREGPPQASAWQGQSQKPNQGYQQSPRSQDLQREGPQQASAWQGESQKHSQGYQQSVQSQNVQREGPQQGKSQKQSQRQHKSEKRQHQDQKQSPRPENIQGEAPQHTTGWQEKSQKQIPRHEQTPRLDSGESSSSERQAETVCLSKKQEFPMPPFASTSTSEMKQMSQESAPISSKDKTSPVQSIKKQLAKLSVSDLQKIPKRRDPNKAGTLGTKVRVLTNMMQIKFGKNFPSKIVHYDVSFEPERPKYLYRAIFQAARQKLFSNRYPVFDGKKNVFSGTHLKIGDPETVEVEVIDDDGKSKSFRVTFKKANEIDVAWLRNVGPGLQSDDRDEITLQALNVILSNAPVMRSTPVGRSYFSPPTGKVVSLGGGLDLWYGLFQSAVIGWKPFLNVDVAHKGFPTPQNVLELIHLIICENARQEAPRDIGDIRRDDINRNKMAIESYLKGLRVTTRINSEKRSRQVVNGIVDKIPAEDFFEVNDKKISVLNYFQNVKNYRIRYPTLPLLWIGSRSKNNHVPLEVCQIESGQALQKKLNDKQTAVMVRQAATSTDVRKEKIFDAYNSMRHNDDPSMRNEFDISVNGQFEEVDARVLEPPRLQYNNREVQVFKGVWRSERFTEPSQLIEADGSWSIVNLSQRTVDRTINQFENMFMDSAKKVGMGVGYPLPSSRSKATIRDLRNLFSDLKNKKVKFIFVIFSDYDKSAYSVIKQVSELNVGILTQCLKSITVERKLNGATLDNIIQKVNAKLNGQNHIFSQAARPICLQKPCIIVGADVTHPSPDAKDIPSIAAVAASHDPNAFRYNIEIRLQPPRMEIIQDLKNIMVLQLKFFKEKTGYKPEKIIFYRDGVSEGQFKEVMATELTAIRGACQMLSPNYRPAITFLVVQKRHHIRLFPKDRRQSDDRNCNVRAGTVVDTVITHPTDIDFYLVSHASIQGTARPTKYRCLWDDSSMTEDEIEKLTYFLCHMFTRCTRSVSYPTPTYYAHLAAFRARALTHDVNILLNDLDNEQRKKLTIKAEVLKEMPMFFV